MTKMMFPSSQRVIYRRNPLVEVVCQLRFPTILRIDAEIPVAFQEAILSEFPNYARNVEYSHNVELSDANGQTDTHISHIASSNHSFVSADRKWRVNLTSGFIALSTLDYRRWEEFRSMFVKPLRTLLDVYSPAHFNRVGLRYTDAIDREGLGLGDFAWADLVKPEMLGMLASRTIPESDVRQATQVSELALEDARTMVVNTGMGRIGDNPNTCLIIDTDTFVAKFADVALDGVMETLESLHDPVSSFFQWAIQPRLRDALMPDPDAFKG